MLSSCLLGSSRLSWTSCFLVQFVNGWCCAWRVWLRDSKWQSLLQFDGTAGSGSEDALEEVLTSLMQWAVRVVGASEKSRGGTEVSQKIALEPQNRVRDIQWFSNMRRIWILSPRSKLVCLGSFEIFSVRTFPYGPKMSKELIFCGFSGTRAKLPSFGLPNWSSSSLVKMTRRWTAAFVFAVPWPGPSGSQWVVDFVVGNTCTYKP